jgi:hypothetical protein
MLLSDGSAGLFSLARRPLLEFFAQFRYVGFPVGAYALA